MTKIKPLWDRILLKWVSLEKTVTDSWIYLPQTDKKDIPFLYEVIEISGLVKEIKIWDKVLCGQYSGDEIKIDWENFKIVASDYILAIVQD
jgi:co-chaperonin GroES (HSP10)